MVSIDGGLFISAPQAAQAALLGPAHDALQGLFALRDGDGPTSAVFVVLGRPPACPPPLLSLVRVALPLISRCI